MGTLTYDGSLRVDVEDRLLSHLQMVISAKLRRAESFLFTWTRPETDGGGRTTLWLDRTIPLTFDYSTSELPTISRAWVESLTKTTFQVTGLQIIPDPQPDTAPVPVAPDDYLR